MKLFTHHASFIFYALMILVIAVLDALAGTQVNLWLFGVPIGLAAWNLGCRSGTLLAALAAALLAGTAYFLGHTYSNLGYFALACGSEVIAYFVLVSLLGALCKHEISHVYHPPKS